MKQTEGFELRKVLRDVSLRLGSEKIASLPEAVPETAAEALSSPSEGGAKGEVVQTARFRGPDWTIELRQLSPVAVGLMTMEQLELRIRGSEETVTSLWDRLQYKFLRGGA